jgi:hypothetical protein
VKETVTDWLNGLTADFYDEGAVKHVQHPDKCLNSNGDYIDSKHMLCLVATLKLFGWLKFSFVYNKTVVGASHGNLPHIENFGNQVTLTQISIQATGRQTGFSW